MALEVRWCLDGLVGSIRVGLAEWLGERGRTKVSPKVNRNSPGVCIAALTSPASNVHPRCRYDMYMHMHMYMWNVPT